MDFASTIDLIIKDLKDASEIIDDLKKYPGVPLLQVELAKSKCRSAADVISLLKQTGIPVEEVVHQAPAATTEAKPVKTVKQEKPVSKPVITEKQIPVPKQQPEPVDDYTITIEHEHSDEVSIAERYMSTTDNTTETGRGVKPEPDLSDKLKAKQMTSITDAIGISDKFLFIGEIFGGSKDAYTATISKLDSASGIAEALEILKNVTEGMEENEAVLQLTELVKIKFPSNE